MTLNPRLIVDPVFKDLLSRHLYAIGPNPDRRVVEQDALVMLRSWMHLIQRFEYSEINAAIDALAGEIQESERNVA